MVRYGVDMSLLQSGASGVDVGVTHYNQCRTQCWHREEQTTPSVVQGVTRLAQQCVTRIMGY